MDPIASAVVQTLNASFVQQISTAVARQGVKGEREVAALVAQGIAPAAPPGQGQVVDRRV